MTWPSAFSWPRRLRKAGPAASEGKLVGVLIRDQLLDKSTSIRKAYAEVVCTSVTPT